MLARTTLALALLAGCTCESPPVVPTSVPTPERHVEPPSRPEHAILAWRTAPPETSSVLLAIPPYPCRLEELLPGSHAAVMNDATRLVVLAPAEAGVAGLRRHGPGSATTSLREVLGDLAFDRLVLRLGSATGRPNRAVLDSTDVRGASVALGLAELGFRALGESANEALRMRAAEDGTPISALLSTDEAVRWGEHIPEAEVRLDLLERIEDPARTASWGDALRSAFDAGSPGALDAACREPERTSSWTEASREARRLLAESIAERVATELAIPHTVIALDGCLVAGDTGLVGLLAARGVTLAQLVPPGAATPEAPPTEAAPAEAPPAEAAPSPTAPPTEAAPAPSEAPTAPPAE